MLPHENVAAGRFPTPIGLASGRDLKPVYRRRGLAVALPLIPSVFVPALWSPATPVTVLAGGGLLLVGWLVRIWPQRHVCYRLRTRKQLTDCGPYRFVRNPIYLANSVIVSGAVIAAGGVRLAPAVLAWCAVIYPLVVVFEESLLARSYGEPYLRYCRRTPRWLPRFDGSRAPCRHRGWTAALLAELHGPLLLLPAIARLFFPHTIGW